jgi:excisionase family DNA binding protein
MMTTEEPLLTVQQAAHLLAVNKKWVYDACARRTIPYIKVGHFTRFRRSELEDWLRNNHVSVRAR